MIELCNSNFINQQAVPDDDDDDDGNLIIDEGEHVADEKKKVAEEKDEFALDVKYPVVSVVTEEEKARCHGALYAPQGPYSIENLMACILV